MRRDTALQHQRILHGGVLRVRKEDAERSNDQYEVATTGPRGRQMKKLRLEGSLSELTRPLLRS